MKSYANIAEGNALKIDWNGVVTKYELNYIMGNPPFVGFKFASEMQKQDMKTVLTEVKPALLDYVCCWYKKAAGYFKEQSVKLHFVFTNSVSQGQMVIICFRHYHGKEIFIFENTVKEVSSISHYLFDGENIIVLRRKKPI